jgi:hypothetical protein
MVDISFPANSPVQNFSLAGFAVERPRITVVYERCGRGPILRADIQNNSSIRLFDQTVHFLVTLNKISAAVGVLGFISRGDDLLSVWSEDIEHRFFVVALRCRDECMARVLRRWKRLLALLLPHGTHWKAPRQQHADGGHFKKIAPIKFVEVQLRSPHIAFLHF